MTTPDSKQPGFFGSFVERTSRDPRDNRDSKDDHVRARGPEPFLGASVGHPALAWNGPSLEAPPLGESEDDGKGGRRRSKTIARKQMLRERRRMLAQGTVPEVVDYERPQYRAECRHDVRPCLYVSCRYHLYLDVNPVTGSIKLNFPEKEVWELEETCALDVAERGGITLEEVGEIMNLTRERIRQVEVSGLQKLKEGNGELHAFIDGEEQRPKKSGA